MCLLCWFCDFVIFIFSFEIILEIFIFVFLLFYCMWFFGCDEGVLICSSCNCGGDCIELYMVVLGVRFRSGS